MVQVIETMINIVVSSVSCVANLGESKIRLSRMNGIYLIKIFKVRNRAEEMLANNQIMPLDKLNLYRGWLATLNEYYDEKPDDPAEAFSAYKYFVGQIHKQKTLAYLQKLVTRPQRQSHIDE